MKTVSLDEICDIQIGKTPSRSNPDYWYGNLPWVTISDMSTFRFVCETKEKISEKGAKESGSKMIMRGTLLLSFKLSLGKRAFAACDLYTNEAIAALKINNIARVEPHYLYWALGNVDYFLFVDRAAKGKTLNKAKLKKIEIPLPPLSEQKRIAKILDAADALRAKRRESLTLLDDLTQSIFLDMFGDPVTNPMGWGPLRLKEVGEVKTGGTPPSKLEGMFNGDIPFITPGDLRETWSNSVRTVTEEGAKKSRTVQRGATLVCCIGATIGKMGKSLKLSAFNQQINAVSWGTKVDNNFGFELMKFFKQKIAKDGASTTLPILKKSKFENILVPIPPLDLQQRFASTVESIEKQKERLKAQLSQMDTLFASFQQRAFNGEL
ncbi:restriction endonuclease subunit S [Desulfonatronovibrio magnus]|uniref:restriction endonuclease subunit S n=1 Tax=Desulfonatronovibrio magnus TaxID=698827 RepID=UPI0006969EDE|nr:restriction endonuclease subunit S [Desulfonatronovibrio magnus]